MVAVVEVLATATEELLPFEVRRVRAAGMLFAVIVFGTWGLVRWVSRVKRVAGLAGLLILIGPVLIVASGVYYWINSDQDPFLPIVTGGFGVAALVAGAWSRTRTLNQAQLARLRDIKTVEHPDFSEAATAWTRDVGTRANSQDAVIPTTSQIPDPPP